MGPEEDNLIAELRLLRAAGASREKQEALCDRFLPSYLPIAQRAFALYDYCRTRGDVGGDLTSDAFLAEHLRAWRDFFLNAAAIADRPARPPLFDPARKLLVGWHAPDHPLWIRDLPEGNVLVLTARDAGWLQVEGIGHEFYCFRRARLGTRLLRAFHTGRPVFAMLDYCYQETLQTRVEFLGHPAATPTGVLQLALRFGYEIVFLRQTDSPVELIPRPDRDDVGELALQINQRIETEIRAQPTRWLLWVSVDSRWQS